MKENLKKNIVNIFLVRLSKLNDDHLYLFKNALTNDELIRFNAYKSDKNKLVSIVSRGLFRTQFSRILNLPLSDITYIKKYQTKPKLFIESKNKFTDLDFNLSHVEDWVILAISPFQIGIDVEYVLRQNNISSISNRFFSQFEIEKLNNLSSVEKSDLFFKYWTLKEAYLKANGFGLSGRLKDFYYLFDGDGSIKMMSSESKAIINNNWTFKCFSPEKKYRVSFAYKSKEPIIFNFREVDSKFHYLNLDWTI